MPDPDETQGAREHLFGFTGFKNRFLSHYYGDDVRRLFLVGAIIVLIGLPFYPTLLPPLSVFAVITVTLIIVGLAGVTNPSSKNVTIFNLIIAAFLFLIFEYFATTHYRDDPFALSVIREALALTFLFAVYYSSKTLRGMVLTGR